jgi:hypothetical protein
MLVDNRDAPLAGVKGTFIYQRKSKSQSWEDVPPTSLRTIKVGEEYRLELHSGELRALHDELEALYALHQKAGVPRGQAQYIKAHGTLTTLAQMTDDELSAVVEGAESLGPAAVARLVRWAKESRNFPVLFERLEQLEPESLQTLNAVLGVALMKRALRVWQQNRDSADEAHWQTLLASQTFVLEQIFSLPILVIQEKAYVGGKSISNTGGHIADFLFKNAVTNSVGLIEIKTPKTPLLGSEYRVGVHNISSDLAGAIQQVLTYRQSLIDERSVLRDADSDLAACSPRCVVLIGHAKKQLVDRKRRMAFDLFRRQLSGVEVITYDEMFERTRRLVSVLERGVDND